MVFVMFADGFEEVESMTIVDYLRRGGIDAKMVSNTDELTVTGAHGVKMQAEIKFSEADFDACEMIVLPGGLPGAEYLRDNDALMEQIKKFADGGKRVAAICAAPIGLARAGVLEGKKATCYPGIEKQLGDCKYTAKKDVVTDGLVTTSRGPATAIWFALELVEILKGKEVAQSVRKGLLA